MDVFDIRLFEIRVVHLAHDASPPFLGIKKLTVFIDVVGIKVIGTSFLRIEGEVQCLDIICLTISLVSVREQFAYLYFADIRVRQELGIVFHVSGDHRRVALGPHTVNIIPSQERTVLAIVHII